MDGTGLMAGSAQADHDIGRNDDLALILVAQRSDIGRTTTGASAQRQGKSSHNQIV
jgi:hypothetical protein